MSYAVKEIYYTLQGEGAHTGRAAIFCRFTGCNLWSGLEKDRITAVCNFCDTDFVGTNGPGGGKYKTANLLVTDLINYWPDNNIKPFVVFTGGEPLLQLDKILIDELHNNNFEIAVETNGTIIPPDNIDWICVSPKIGSELILKKGNEVKFVYPQKNIDPQIFIGYEFDHFYLQPMDGLELNKNIKLCVQYCKENPIWKLSLQTHKILHIP